MSINIPSIHETFNARPLSTQELCRSFIVSEHFDSLASSNHVIMVGPRGSGKTTLMRMLQVESLDMWDSSQAKSYRELIKYSGVFISTDRFWKRQYDALVAKMLGKDAEKILHATFIYHVLERLARTTNYRAYNNSKFNNFRTVTINKKDESELVCELAEFWRVEPKISSLRSLEIAVTQKKQEILSYIDRILSGRNESNSEPEIVLGNISSIIGNSVSIINTIFNQPESKWVFLFDELELAPDHIVQPLVDAMRGGPDNVIFKLSLSPYHKNVIITNHADSSMGDQDLAYINLTGNEENSGLKFSKLLCGNILSKHGHENPVDEYFETPKDVELDHEFQILCEKEEKFKDYLERNGIYIDSDGKIKKNRSIARKVQFIVYLRNYYRVGDRRKGRRRPCDYYGGADSLFKAMEYNPRMVIGLTNMLLPYIKERGYVDLADQIKCLQKSRSTFESLLRSIPLDGFDRKKVSSLNDLLNVIGEYFNEEVVGDFFVAEPKGTLHFKNNDSEVIAEAIGIALNAGALVAVNDTQGGFQDADSIKYSRCRLSYMFAHKYKLLLTLGRPVESNKVLEHTLLTSNTSSQSIKQLDLL